MNGLQYTLMYTKLYPVKLHRKNIVRLDRKVTRIVWKVHFGRLPKCMCHISPHNTLNVLKFRAKVWWDAGISALQLQSFNTNYLYFEIIQPNENTNFQNLPFYEIIHLNRKLHLFYFMQYEIRLVWRHRIRIWTKMKRI